jgi:ribosome maturation factor RimP
MNQNSTERPSLAERLRQAAEPLCLSEAMELVHTETLSAPGGLLIRFFIDKPGGVSIDDCVHMTRILGDVIDVQFDEIGSYRLEISSPGPNRPLAKESDFLRFTGRRVRIELKEPIGGRKRFTGVLKGFTNGSVELALDRETVNLEFRAIAKARLAGTYGE